MIFADMGRFGLKAEWSVSLWNDKCESKMGKPRINFIQVSETDPGLKLGYRDQTRIQGLK